MHCKVLVEPGDRQRPVGLETRRSEMECRAVLEPRAGLDQDAKRGRVDEVDFAKVDDEPFRLLGAKLEERRAHLGCVVKVELAREVDHDGPIRTIDSSDRMFVQSRLVRHAVHKHSHVASG